MVLIFSLLIHALNASPQADQMATEVIKLRQEVELLNDEYKTDREKILNDLKVLSVQKAELAANIRSEEIRKEQLLEKTSTLKQSINEASLDSESLQPILEQAIERLRESISESLPFKKSERLQALNELEERIQKQEISLVKAANHLWALYEDEKRLAKETSIHRQTITVGQQQKLAEVIKLGMMLMYFKTDDGLVGLVSKAESGWEYQAFRNEDKKQRTLAFFDSLKKQIRTGFFDIPTGEAR